MPVSNRTQTSTYRVALRKHGGLLALDHDVHISVLHMTFACIWTDQSAVDGVTCWRGDYNNVLAGCNLKWFRSSADYSHMSRKFWLLLKSRPFSSSVIVQRNILQADRLLKALDPYPHFDEKSSKMLSARCPILGVDAATNLSQTWNISDLRCLLICLDWRETKTNVPVEYS